MAIMFFVMQGWTQTTLNESFEGTTFPPNDWTIATTSGIGNWQSSTDLVHTGIKSAASAYASNGCTRWLITPKLSVTSDATTFAFWIATDAWYGDGDNIDILISTTDNQTSSFSTTTLLSLNQDSVTTTWVQHSVDLSSYIGQDIYIAIRVIDQYGFSTFIDDVTGPNLFVPSCPKPTNITFSNITTTSADISWVNGSPTDNTWLIFYKETDSTSWDSITVTSNPFTLSLLNLNTSYDVYIKTDCSTELSEPSDTFTFRTQCDAISTLPWSENFDSYYGAINFPTCWRKLSGSYPAITMPSSSQQYHSYPAVLSFRSSPSNPTFAITPAFSADINTLMVTFWLKATDIVYAGTITIGVMESDTSTFEAVQTITPTTTSWTQYTVMLNGVQLQGGGKHIAFKHNSNSNLYYYRLDDIIVNMIPDCPNVYGLTAEAASTTSVSVNWTNEENNGNGYNIAYSTNLTGTLAFDPTYATSVAIPTGTTLPYIISGFNPGDSVWIAVKRGCDGGNWTNAVKVNLPTFANSIPFVSNFEDSTLDTIWKISNGTQTNKWYIGAPGANDSDPTDINTERGLFISNDVGASASYDNHSSSVVFASTLIEFNNSPAFQLSFDWSCVGHRDFFGLPYDYLNVYLLPLEYTLIPGTLPNAQYKLNTQELCNSNLFQEFSTTLNSNYSNKVKRLVFAWENIGYGGSNPPSKIDNISLIPLECGMPSNFRIDSCHGTEAYLSWTEPQGATSWIVEYNSTGIWNQTLATSNPFTLTGLNPGTAYQIRVRSVCNTSDSSSISNTINFQTSCVTGISTFFEGFNLGVVPPTTCWQEGIGALSTLGVSIVSPITANSNNSWFYNSYPMQSDWGGHASLNLYPYNPPVNYWLISPSINAGDGTSPLQIEFDLSYSSENALSSVSSGDNDNTFAVVVSTDNGSTWNSSDIIRKYDNSVNSPITLDSIGVTPHHIIIPLFNSLSQPYTGGIKIGLFGSSLTSNVNAYLHIDNIELVPFVTCQRPTNLLASAVTSSTANIYFTENGSATSWQYVISDGTVTDPNNGTTVTTTNAPTILTGLTPQTEYTIWIRSNCINQTSIWSQPLRFTTEAIPASVPYSCNFENLQETQKWRKLSSTINNWVIGQAAGNGLSTIDTNDSTAAYISNNYGASYATNYDNIYAYSYRDIDFGTNVTSYTLKFDWKCKGYISGTTIYSGLRVYLSDPSEFISVSELPRNENDTLGSFYNASPFASTWQNAQLPIDNVSGVKRLIFVYYDEYHNSAPPAAIDNISIRSICSRPYNLATSNTSTTYSDISWSHPGADSYIVSYRPTSSISLTDEETITSPYTIQNLTPGTEYIVKIKAICSGDTTMYSDSLIFTTPCSDFSISSFPWFEGFENGISCWSQQKDIRNISWLSSNGYFYDTYYSTYDTIPHTGNKIAYFIGNNSVKTRIISPKLDITQLTLPYLKYWYVMKKEFLYSEDTLKVYYRPNEDSAWTLLKTLYAINQASWRTDSIALLNPSSTYQIAFEGIGSNGHGIGLDDVKVYDLSPCLAPNGLSANVAHNSTTISWNAGGSETNWQIKLNSNGTPIDIQNTPTYSFNNLTTGTSYTAYIRANCGSYYSPWVSITFANAVVANIYTSSLTNNSATLTASYTQGSDAIIAKGFDWKLNSVSNWNTQIVTDVANPFSYSLTGLVPSTMYDVRAYVMTAYDTAYSSIIQFTTLATTPPSVTTDSIANISHTSAIFYGTITQGTEEINARGFEYKLPTEEWADAVVLSATGTNSISAEANDLQPYTSYNVRAYARTNSDKYYGQELNFQTLTLTSIDKQPINIMMYPNPANNETKLIISGVQGDTKIVLSDVQGRILNTINTKAINGVVEQTIDVNNLAKGVYYVRIQNSNLNRTNKLIVK